MEAIVRDRNVVSKRNGSICQQCHKNMKAPEDTKQENWKTMRLRLVGDSPLICNRWTGIFEECTRWKDLVRKLKENGKW